MNKEELIKKLISLNVHPKYYSVGVEIKDNAHNIERLYNGKYAVYYLEKGKKNGFIVFDSEEEALEELIKNLEFDLKYGLDLSK